ncbi:MAG: SpoIIE family protein phosphatase [Bacteroidales bacterium]|nr:SpoIIE family protein phosphatase [Bacteroidales bacterium]
MKRYIGLILLLYPLLSFAQEGTPFISHFNETGRYDLQNWAICQGDHGLMYFANRHGLLTFDGNRWVNKRLSVTPLTLGKDPYSNTIYIGGRGSFGYLVHEAKDGISYTKISADSTDTGIISEILFKEKVIIFSGEDAVYLYDRETASIVAGWTARKDQPFSGATYINDKLYINVAGKGLHRIDSDTLFPIVTGYLTENDEILFTLPYSDDKILLGTSDNKLALFDGIKYYDYNLSQENYLENNVLNKGLVLGDSLYAFSTLYGGAIVVNKKSAEVLHTINYRTGLPDDEVFAMASDNNSGLWLSHSYGISRIDLRLPLRSYSGFPGLEGIPIVTARFNKKLYVATNTGLFILEEVKSYKDVEVFYRVTREAETKTPVKHEQAVEEVTTETAKKERGNIFNRLFKKKQKENEALSKDEVKDETPIVEELKPEAPKTVLRKRTVSELQSISWMYKKVDGIDTRCSSLRLIGNSLFAIAGTGLYEVEDKVAKLIYSDRSINAIAVKDELMVAASENGLTGINLAGKSEDEIKIFNHDTPVYSLAFSKNGVLWAGGNNIIYCFEQAEGGRYREKGWYYHDSDFMEQCRIDIVNDTVFHFSESGIFYFSEDEQVFLPWITGLTNDNQIINEYILEQNSKPWLKLGEDWCLMEWLQDSITYGKEVIRLFDNIKSINIDVENNIWIIDEEKGVFRINDISKSSGSDFFNLYVTGIRKEDDGIMDSYKLVLEQGERVSINLSAPHYLKETSTEYQYYIEGIYNDWTKWSNNPWIDIPLESGNYTMHTRARNILGNITGERTIFITKKPPFTSSVWFYIIIGMVIVLLIWFVTNMRQRKLVYDKKVLEIKVQERTIELENKKTQIEAQRDEIIRQKEEITSSITYARKIQEAILPDNKLLERNFSDYFIYYKPRDIVSGDFYWTASSKSYFYFAVADCTGHGVPGAIMSMLGISILNEITGEGTIDIQASEVLDMLRSKIISALHHSGAETQANDGMDISLFKFIRKTKIIEFSGAFNPLYHYRGANLTEYKADRMPIGYLEKSLPFSNQSFKVKKGDTLYLFSDGYYDQFGGPKNKRFSSKNLRITLTGIVEMPMHKQSQFLDERFKEWKGDNEQLDDIIIAGIRF